MSVESYLAALKAIQEQGMTRQILCGEQPELLANSVSQGANFSVNCLGSYNTNVTNWFSSSNAERVEPIEVTEKDLLPEEHTIASQWKVEED